MLQFNVHEVGWSVGGEGGHCDWGWGGRCDAVGVEAAVHPELHRGVQQGAVGTLPTPALTRLPRDCRHKVKSLNQF